jgi:hypothetical protein
MKPHFRKLIPTSRYTPLYLSTSLSYFGNQRRWATSWSCQQGETYETMLTNDCDPRPSGRITPKVSDNSWYIGPAIMSGHRFANRLSFISEARVSILFSWRMRGFKIGPIVGDVHLYIRRIDLAVAEPCGCFWNCQHNAAGLVCT